MFKYKNLINNITIINLNYIFINYTYDTLNESLYNIADSNYYINNKYIYKSKLGGGSYGNVLKCIDNKHQEYAIKMISKDIDNNIIKNEINILKKLTNITKDYYLIDYFYDNYYYYIVTNYISGISLYSYLKRVKYIDEEKIINILKQLTNKLLLLKINNIIHNDIKLDNIIINLNNNKITLIDYGSSNNSNNTLVYSPPEFLNNNIITYQNDIWAMGCLIYILICGEHPFDHDKTNNEDVIINNIKLNNISFKNKKWLLISENTKMIIKQMLNKDPNKRITIEELQALLV